MTTSSQVSPTPTGRLEFLTDQLDRSIRSSGSDSLSTRMLRAEIARLQKAQQEGPKTMAEQYQEWSAGTR